VSLSLNQGGALTAWPLLVLATVLVYNISETVAALHIGWVLLVSLGTVTMRRTTRDATDGRRPQIPRVREAVP
jgi:hypothetical protein